MTLPPEFPTETEVVYKTLPPEFDSYSTRLLTLLFEKRIQIMNETFKLPSNDTPTDQGDARLIQIEDVLQDEVMELLEPIAMRDSIDRFVGVADCLGDIVVYCFSEARRWGIPLLDVLHIIMDSQDSKLVNGEPVMAPDGSKFIKGPNYAPPEPRLRLLFERLTSTSDSDNLRST